jgi:hypothetical protein
LRLNVHEAGAFRKRSGQPGATGLVLASSCLRSDSSAGRQAGDSPPSKSLHPLSAISMNPSGSMIALDQCCSRGANCILLIGSINRCTLGIARFARSCAVQRPFPLYPHVELFPSCSGHLGHLAKTLWTFAGADSDIA